MAGGRRERGARVAYAQETGKKKRASKYRQTQPFKKNEEPNLLN